MILSRSGIDLNEIWQHQVRCIEADEDIRRRQRRAAAEPGDVAAQEGHRRSLLRSGRHDEYMHPHMERYKQAFKAYEDARNVLSRKGNWPDLREKRDKAKAAHDEAQKVAHEHATHTGRPAGSYLHPEKDEPHFAHMERVARLHDRGGYTWDQDTSGRQEKIHFFDDEKNRDHFQKALTHHYGNQYEFHPRSKKKDGPHFDNALSHSEEPLRLHIRRHSKSPTFDAEHP